MSVLPERKPGDWERRHWEHGRGIREDLEKRVFDSLSELEEALPHRHDFEGVEVLKTKEGSELRADYELFGGRMDSGGVVYLAYFCGECDEVRAQRPVIEDEDSISSQHPLSGRRGYDVRCVECNSYLDRVTHAMS